MDNIIEVKNVFYEYTDEDVRHTAVNGVSFAIERGSFTVILGHNGSGKSTLAKMLNGLLKPTSGEVLVDGINTANEETEIEVKRRVGMVFQNPDNQLVASIVEEDVAFGPENLGLEPSVIRERVDEALKSVGMYEFRESTPHHLSGGQKQRIAIAGIIAMQPECLILDEPTAMLDPVGRAEIIKTLHKLNKEKNITVVLITHYMEEAENADRVMVMNDGVILSDNTPKEIFKNVSQLKLVGLSVPQTTELLYALKQNGFDVSTDVLSIEETAKAIALCLEER
ncbi:MAG: energy-coupling factor transporter ATPase [Clostridia bacterium]|nr:energy-coupling factor transporter ATPase [Clostridia bacterium]MBR6564998.1 energy-coupling factor transporter ATPase [Clostridia bacterium]MBR6741546.1 energy-coupling factor transporter ATPase [Clostridia bacterium]